VHDVRRLTSELSLRRPAKSPASVVHRIDCRSVRGLAVDRCKMVAVSGTGDGAVTVWDAATGVVQCRLPACSCAARPLWGIRMRTQLRRMALEPLCRCCVCRAPGTAATVVSEHGLLQSDWIRTLKSASVLPSLLCLSVWTRRTQPVCAGPTSRT
jgi:hypothetical protein